MKRDQYNKNPLNGIYYGAKDRAKKAGMEFTIEKSDLYIPSHCPVLGLELRKTRGTPWDRDASLSIDRIDSSKGYVPGNVRVISYRANLLKNNATAEEMRKILDDLVQIEAMSKPSGRPENPDKS